MHFLSSVKLNEVLALEKDAVTLLGVLLFDNCTWGCPSFVFTGVLYVDEIAAQNMDDCLKSTSYRQNIFNFYARNISMYFSGSLAGWFYTSNLLMISVLPWVLTCFLLLWKVKELSLQVKKN